MYVVENDELFSSKRSIHKAHNHQPPVCRFPKFGRVNNFFEGGRTILLAKSGDNGFSILFQEGKLPETVPL